MPDPFSIEQINAAQIDRLLSVPEGLFDNPFRSDQAAAFLADPGNILLLAFDGDLAVGMITATILRHPDKAPSLYVNELGTRDSHLRRGIASALVTKVIAMARARGCEGIWLETETDNHPAIALYRKLGGAEKGFVGFGWDNAL